MDPITKSERASAIFPTAAMKSPVAKLQTGGSLHAPS